MTYYRPFQPPLAVMRPEEIDAMFPYRATVKADKRELAYAWAHDNAKDDWTSNWVHSPYLKTTVVNQTYQIMFRSKNDALLCKLKWG